MNATKTLHSQNNLTVVHVLAALLGRLENSPLPVAAEQYRAVVSHLVDELNVVHSDRGLDALLNEYPGAAQVYENLNYAHAGLCRSSLEASLLAEQQAKAMIERAMRPSKEGSTDGQS